MCHGLGGRGLRITEEASTELCRLPNKNGTQRAHFRHTGSLLCRVQVCALLSVQLHLTDGSVLPGELKYTLSPHRSSYTEKSCKLM